MEYNKSFEKLLESMPDNEHVGLGNPNAKILFIGKEAGSEIGSEIYHGSAKSWIKKEFDYSKRYIPTDINVRNLNHTWQRYQKLYDSIYQTLHPKTENENKDKYEINFIENVFTTELSDIPAKNTGEAKKQDNFSQKLAQRKQAFFKSDFIHQFPIVIIFADDNKYIETYPGEVCELFEVKFDHKHNYMGKDNIWIHSSNMENKPKLLIHTRQLTNSISKELIASLSEIIVTFIKQHSIGV